MISFPEVQHYHLLSLSWVDAADEYHSVMICAVASNKEEQTFRKEFDNKGWLYRKVLEEANVNATDVKHLRIVGSPMPVIVY
jgi:hypothetical protein